MHKKKVQKGRIQIWEKEKRRWEKASKRTQSHYTNTKYTQNLEIFWSHRNLCQSISLPNSVFFCVLLKTSSPFVKGNTLSFSIFQIYSHPYILFRFLLYLYFRIFLFKVNNTYPRLEFTEEDERTKEECGEV